MITEGQVKEHIVEPQTDTQHALDEAAKVRYLERDDFTLFKTDGGGLRLTLTNERSFLRVKARLCFPLTHPTGYVSLRDGLDEEIGLIRDLSEQRKCYRRWIEEDLELCYFTPRVKSIKSIRQRFGGLEWQLTTDRGRKRIITKGVRDTMTEVQIGRYIIDDVDGNRYEIFTDKLDDVSRRWIERLV